MKLNNEFTVDVPVEDVWDVLLDLERITPCLPGASLTEETGEREYDGAMKVKLGPVTQQYKGTVRIQEADESAHRAVLRADGKDARGQGTASATIVSTLHDEGNGSTKVSVETDMQITGRAAQFGQGIQQQVSEKLLGRFADCLEEEITNGGAARGADVSTAGPSANGASGEGQPRAARQQEDVEALDLGEASRGAVLEQIKPAIPLVAGAVVLLLVLRSLRGGSSGRGRGGSEISFRF
ncbi:MAG: Carbon monoxide oxidation accessory protein CoxG [uncultured Rubrobacteraceae bacterium]|uniref:Carbon monoxide oxidation accessory protein CoxG n=1 Tax=uncultured Rubrobacteraceae bacterium TaxID=349277 RepID=A0A6J4PBG5_9ACTN|nr:MAG: Carbon monoxide oxidation accessory protein CoxG [uncultured Rubrobacteraceae bacterium]